MDSAALEVRMQMKIMKRLKNFDCHVLAVIFLSAIMVSQSYAMAKPEHSRLWNEVSGIIDSTSRRNIQRLWDTAQEVIDSYTEDYRDIRKNFDWFTWGNYGHRLLFHWGFNADPKKYSQLMRQVHTCLKNSKNAQEEEKKFFAYITKDIQSRRNRKLINAVIKTTGIPSSQGYANAVATIIYDVHLLGDYSTTNTSALPPIADIENDLIERGFKRLISGGRNTKRVAEIEREFSSAVRIGRGRINSKRAQLLLEAMKKYLPQILSERFHDTLKTHGISIFVKE